MEALRDMLKHADRYGVKWVFVRDPYYEPLLAFAGWRRVDGLEQNTIGVWAKDDVPPAQPVNYNTPPPAWEGVLWGLLPVGSSLLALFLVIVLPEERRRVAEPIAFPAAAPESVALRGVK